MLLKITLKEKRIRGITEDRTRLKIGGKVK